MIDEAWLRNYPQIDAEFVTLCGAVIREVCPLRSRKSLEPPRPGKCYRINERQACVPGPPKPVLYVYLNARFVVTASQLLRLSQSIFNVMK